MGEASSDRQSSVKFSIKCKLLLRVSFIGLLSCLVNVSVCESFRIRRAVGPGSLGDWSSLERCSDALSGAEALKLGGVRLCFGFVFCVLLVVDTDPRSR